MASNGLIKRAAKGTCRMCLRARCTSSKVKAVGQVAHGFATGYVWECIDIDECDSFAQRKLENPMLDARTRRLMEQAEQIGRYETYRHFY